MHINIRLYRFNLDIRTVIVIVNLIIYLELIKVYSIEIFCDAFPLSVY